MDKKIRILLVEDHALTRIGLKTALEETPSIEFIGEAETGEKGVELVQKLVPDVLILDLGLPTMNGIDVIKAVKKMNLNVKILVLTSHDNEPEVIDAVKFGADAYCMKDISPQRLATVIEGISDGGVWFDPAISRVVQSNLFSSDKASTKQPQTKANDQIPLTDRELEILQLLADGIGNIEIAEKLSLSQHTVKAHICNVLQKLAVDDRTQAVSRALRNGWIK